MILDTRELNDILAGLGINATASESARASALITRNIDALDAEIARLTKVRDGLQHIYDLSDDLQPQDNTPDTDESFDDFEDPPQQDFQDPTQDAFDFSELDEVDVTDA